LFAAGKGTETMSTVEKYRELLAMYTPQPIRSQKMYAQALKQLEELMVPHPDAARSMLIELFSTLIEQYESREYPTPEVPPAAMLAQLLKTKDVKLIDVARATKIPLATLSNVLANRRGISKQSAFKLSEYFGLSPIVFLCAKPPRKMAIG
jgi:antitoxin component HigA of HigAB toxin-antitoxin module